VTPLHNVPIGRNVFTRSVSYNFDSLKGGLLYSLRQYPRVIRKRKAMVYQALYRTYRPKQFSEVIGQEHVLRTLLNSIRQNKVGHAYLFSGPRGTGKTTVARLLARAINCNNPVDGEPCGECERCKGSEEGLGVIEIDAASHGSVDDMRQLVAQVSQIPLSGGMMVYIIDEVHMLSKEAFNAFLKTLEEPPPHAVFVLATTEPGKLLPTIHSRCQHFSFRRLPVDTIAGYIGKICEWENVPAEANALRLIARAGDGSVRDSISVLEQAIAYEPEGLTLNGVREVLGIPDRMDIRKLGGQIISCNPGELSKSYASLVESGREPDSILTELMSHFRDILFETLDVRHEDLELLPEEELNELRKQSEGLTPDMIHKAISLLAKCQGEIKWEDEAALILEVSLLRLASRFRKGEKRQAATTTTTSESEADSDEQAFPDAPEVKDPAGAETSEPVSVKDASPTGGRSLKRMKRRPREADKSTQTVPGEASKEKISDSVAAKAEPASEAVILQFPKEIDPLWKNALESVREASIAEYILLAVATPSPTPSELPASDPNSPFPTQLTLKYPFEQGLLVRLVNEPSLVNVLTTRLEEVLERPIELRVAQLRGGIGESGKYGPGQEGMVDGEGRVSGTETRDGPSLFPGAGREPPTDPDLKRIHNLIVREFPDYTVEEGANP